MEKSHNPSHENLKPHQARAVELLGIGNDAKILAKIYQLDNLHQYRCLRILLDVADLLIDRATVDQGNVEEGLEGIYPLEKAHVKAGLEVAEFLALENFSEKELADALKLAHGRTITKRIHGRLGGHHSRIAMVLDYLRDEPLFSERWQKDMKYVSQQYARSTVMKALKIFCHSGPG